MLSCKTNFVLYLTFYNFLNLSKIGNSKEKLYYLSKINLEINFHQKFFLRSKNMPLYGLSKLLFVKYNVERTDACLLDTHLLSFYTIIFIIECVIA